MEQKTLKKIITKKELQILLFLYQFRFLDTRTLQLLLHHKSRTRIQSWLKDLTQKGYLYQFYDRTTYVERTKPAIYCLTTKVRKILMNEKECEIHVLNQIYRERALSIEFREHCIYVANIYIRLNKEYIKENQILKFFTKVDLFGFGRLPKPLPDAYFAIKEKKKKTRRYFIEVFDLNIPKRALKGKIRKYIVSNDNGWVGDRSLKFPKVLFIVRNKYKQRSMKKLIREVRNQEFSNLPFYITNKETIEKLGLADGIWEYIEA